MNPIVIIGSGHAGLTLARELRAKSSDVPLVVLSKEEICAYYKPNLSKALSMGKTPAQLIMKDASVLTKELNAKLIGRVEVQTIDHKARRVRYRTEQGEIHQLDYQALVLATGASPIQLPVEKSSSVPFLAINNVNDYRTFRNAIEGKKRVLIIGAGFVGCELASDLSGAGYEVQVVDKGQWPLQRAIPEVIGSTIKKAMAENGVQWHFGKTVEAAHWAGINQQTRAGKPVEVTLSDGTVLETDIIISAVGLKAETKLAIDAGLSVGQGIVIDSFSQTSQEHIYALGDCVQYEGSTMPFIAPATQSAKALAQTLTGTPTAFALPAMAVAVKISACPTVMWPSVKSRGVWEVQGAGMDLEAHFMDEHGSIIGFALTGACIAQKNVLSKRCLDEAARKNEAQSAEVTTNNLNLPNYRESIVAKTAML
ncbi:MAG: FAD-dependent oxidoreductase [Hahellaceae bacterium]|nr:FAD-dependent oxidoreductase [Hahellaceae bacterium]